MKFEQEFLISARKPIVFNGEFVYALSVVVVTTIETTRSLDNEEELWGLFIDEEYQPNEMSPLLLAPLPESQLMILSEEELNNSSHTFKFYKDVYKDSMKPKGLERELPYCDTVAIEQREFYKILNNDLHFNHKANNPCRSI